MSKKAKILFFQLFQAVDFEPDTYNFQNKSEMPPLFLATARYTFNRWDFSDLAWVIKNSFGSPVEIVRDRKLTGDEQPVSARV